MNQRLERLQLNHASVDLACRPKDRETIVRDIQQIHSPAQSRLRSWGMRTWAMGSGLNLPAPSPDAPHAAFGARIDMHYPEKIHISFDNAARSRQAAGWAALQLYGELRTRKPLIEKLFAIDPQADTARRQQRAIDAEWGAPIIWALDTRDTSLNPSLDLPPRPALIITPDISPKPEHIERSALFFSNDHQHSLPGILAVIKTSYDEFYPEVGSAATSAAVAGLVGASSLEAFTDAWNVATTHEPVVAAQTLLGSGVFLDA